MTLVETPFPYQIVGAEWLAPKTQAFLADSMGLGKSCQAIRAADIVGAQDILIICPSNVKVNWEREFEKFSPMDRPCTVIWSSSDPLPPKGVVIVSYEIAQARAQEFKARSWELVVLDEAHYLKAKVTKRTKAIYGAHFRFKGIIHSAKRVWRLSGTPAPNDASELWTHLRSAEILTGNYWDFVFKFCTGFDSQFGFKITGHKNVPELKEILKPFMLRRTKEEVMKQLPPITYQTVTVERSKVALDPDFYEQVAPVGEAKFYENLEQNDKALRNALGALAHTEAPNEARLGVLEAMAPGLVTLRRYTAMAKLPAVCDLIKEELDIKAYEKIVLFGVHRSVIEGARDAFSKYGAVTLYGQTPPAKRQANIDRFMRDPSCRVFIGNIQAAGVGINGLQETCHEVAFLEQDWVPANNAQAAMRVHRIGQKKHVRVRIFSLYKSIDEQVQETLMRKARELSKIF